ncbi:MAG: type II toxin-antitoxin system prevent-host-death family antitoxin [Nakamurella sp.]
MTTSGTVSVRDLRNHGGEVLDRVGRGESVTITRDGVPAAELRPVPRSRLSTAALIERRRHLPAMDPQTLIDDIDAVVDQSW